MIRQLMPVIAIGLLLAGQAQAQTSSKAASQTAKSSPIVNLNTATAAELEQLPGVGPSTAARIIDYRQKKGPFKKIEEIMNVKGIGEKSFLKLKPQISVGGKSEPAAQD